MEENARTGILQRDKETVAIVARIPVGVMSPEQLERIAAAARKSNAKAIKITSAQRIALVGIHPDKVEEAWAALGMAEGPAVGVCVHYVQACPGTDYCRLGVQNSLGLGARLESLLVGAREMPAKTKVGVSGCKMNCAEGLVRDVGLYGTRNGWTAAFGGNSGLRPRIADVIAEDLTEDHAVDLVMKCLDFYAANAKRKERTARFIERIGIEEFRKCVL